MRARESLRPGKAVLAAVAAALVASTGTADEAVWPQNSASEVAVMATMLRFGIHADHCSLRVPELKPKFDSLMQDLNRRIQDISTALLASDEFKGMKELPVPQEILDALKDSFHDGEHNLERQDAAAICPKTLQNFGEVDDESLEYGLKANLSAVRTMTEKQVK